MIIAIPTWDGNVSPVLDVARELLVVECNLREESARREILLAEMDICRRADMIRGLELDTLICGALSRPLELLLSAAGIRLLTHICGPVEAVLEAHLDGSLSEGAFRMPGCCGRRRNRRGHRGNRGAGFEPESGN
jgi:predicted Fe-Mo cluster-binding NifX family protein